ncbi:MAG: thiamine phosphate synthase [Kiritimatiellia bacterium]
MKLFGRAGLYVVTSSPASRGRSTEEIAEAVLASGVRLLQVREKEMTARELTDLSRRIRKMTRRSGALLIVNDRLDAALAAEADGVHLGTDDLPVKEARRLAPDLVIGASTHSVDEAVRAQEDGASYVNIGPLFPTATKEYAGRCLGMEGLREISSHVKIPFTVMGGIRKEHVPSLLAAGARTIAVVSAVTAAPDPAAAAAELLEEIRRQSGG